MLTYPYLNKPPIFLPKLVKSNIWVAHTIMIEDFKLFKDAVTFDTTYKIFRMFCGVNHHRKTVIF
ncbi:hypothetical protein ZOSMA_45G00210 [Zostera marina]|uniref:Protein FAR1-RELATED SEQUENCE n=1 Tax=Zostera marina TaxID=29655 RepID=A0A0K9P2K5_ZOSMR|nr:hypothetical protein ZOSMA_45G00210 [Zostera marina]